jgi:hypothetical protein
VKGILDYFEFGVVTKIRVISQKSIDFPTITICDASIFTTKEAENLLVQAKQLDEEFYSNRGSNLTLSEIRFKIDQLDNFVDFAFSKMASQKRDHGFFL